MDELADDVLLGGDELVAEYADALVRDDALVPSEDGDQVPEEVEEEVHGPFRPVRRTGSTALLRLIAIREQGAVAVEEYADSVVLEAVEGSEWMDDEVDVQPAGRGAESAHDARDRSARTVGPASKASGSVQCSSNQARLSSVTTQCTSTSLSSAGEA